MDYKTQWECRLVRSIPEDLSSSPLTRARVRIASFLLPCGHKTHQDKFFGIDKIFPDDGYTLDNCVSACASCNRDKWKYTIDEFTLRDERITTRYLEGFFDDLPSIPKHINHIKK